MPPKKPLPKKKAVAPVEVAEPKFVLKACDGTKLEGACLWTPEKSIAPNSMIVASCKAPGNDALMIYQFLAEDEADGVKAVQEYLRIAKWDTDTDSITIQCFDCPPPPCHSAHKIQVLRVKARNLLTFGVTKDTKYEFVTLKTSDGNAAESWMPRDPHILMDNLSGDWSTIDPTSVVFMAIGFTDMELKFVNSEGKPHTLESVTTHIGGTTYHYNEEYEEADNGDEELEEDECPNCDYLESECTC